jgi:hypothetical protein
MDYQSQTMSVNEMNQRLADLLVEMRAIGEKVEAIADDLEADYTNTTNSIAKAQLIIDNEYVVLDAAEAGAEGELDAIILGESESLAEGE